jgi:hypothetical protein
LSLEVAVAGVPVYGAPPGGNVPSPVNFRSVTKGPVKVAFTMIPGCGRNELFTSVVTKEGVAEKFTENTLTFGSNALVFGLGVAKK